MPPTTDPTVRPGACLNLGRTTEPKDGLTDHGDDDRLLSCLAQDAMKLSPEDGEARSRTPIPSAHRADEDWHLVHARREKLLASRRTQAEFRQLIAKAAWSNAHRHATTV